MINTKIIMGGRSPLKWPGGKYKLLDRIKKHMHPSNRLIEPFAGSCVVSLNTDYKKFLLNDINKDLISFYKILKKEKQGFIEYARELFIPENNTEEEYYYLREEFNSTSDIRYKSAILIYINRHGYNGLLRYNSSGILNVPIGRYKKPYFPEKELQQLILLTKRSTFQNKDFEVVMRSAVEGDIIYCDPPYVPLSPTANFTAYSSGGFNQSDHERLVQAAQDVSKNGITVIISNHSTPYTQKLYKNAIQSKFPVRRMISCKSENRKKVSEILAVYPSQEEQK